MTQNKTKVLAVFIFLLIQLPQFIAHVGTYWNGKFCIKSKMILAWNCLKSHVTKLICSWIIYFSVEVSSNLAKDRKWKVAWKIDYVI